MNALPVDLCLDPRPFVHMVVRREHPIFSDYRYACLCGWRSPWLESGSRSFERDISHPDRQVTRSRTDLRLIPHPVNA